MYSTEQQRLTNIANTIKKALSSYTTVNAFRFDLRLPEIHNIDGDSPTLATSQSDISQLFAILRRLLSQHAKRVNYSKPLQIRYSWKREKVDSENHHYHILVIINNDLFWQPGHTEAPNTLAWYVEHAWCETLGLMKEPNIGLVYSPPGCYQRFNQRWDGVELPYFATYLAKEKSCYYNGGSRAFGTSKI